MSDIRQSNRHRGVLQIVRFNWPKYLVALGCIGAAFAIRRLLPGPAQKALIAAVVPAVYWAASSLLASHYIYDRSHLYDFSWMQRAFHIHPRHWLNIHCGLDEATSLLFAQFPNSSGETIDIFDPHAMTESSIRRARKERNDEDRSTARFDALPFAERAFDAVFCIFAAHELRRHADRVRLFKEIARLLTPGGIFVLVEHLRDWPNFVAFGPGFLHFHSWRAWQRAACEAGLVLHSDFPMTPFVRAATFRRAL